MPTVLIILYPPVIVPMARAALQGSNRRSGLPAASPDLTGRKELEYHEKKTKFFQEKRKTRFSLHVAQTVMQRAISTCFSKGV